MSRWIHAGNLADELLKFRLWSGWQAECTLAEQTATAGPFFHGTPAVNVRQFTTRRTGSGRLSGIYFTQDPTRAACHAANIGFGFGGRLYRVELATRNPLFVEDWTEWFASVEGNRALEEARCHDAKEAGHDCIVTLHFDGTILEIIVLDDQAVRWRETCRETLKPWKSPKAAEALVFYQAEGAPAPDYAPGSVPIFHRRKDAESRGNAARVLVNATNPIYCDRTAWPRMDFDVLRYAPIDCLIDPADRSALVIDPVAINEMDREVKRAMRVQLRRRTALKGVRV